MRARRRLQCGCRRLRRLVAEDVDVKVRRQSTEPWGEPLGFIGATDVRKATVHLDLRAYHDPSPHHDHGICAPNPYPFPPKSHRMFRLPGQTRTLYQQKDTGQKSFLQPGWAQEF